MAYLMTSWPEGVGLSSGSAARRPRREILERWVGWVVVKVRWEWWRRGVRRRRGGIVRVEVVGVWRGGGGGREGVWRLDDDGGIGGGGAR